ncbi:hypothetical protein B9Z55_017134 [Caenorhabditis nigoni]|uniref:Uncharacterized protein n=1 Tax=Caenorhabditis nigoni TaxID=1611254 RepID=A0A2G5T839_9PELO|nr:hypothetical protein B9Z55_017134 [Caenorhabditis nigoni]
MVAPKAPRRHLACIGSRLTLRDKTPRKPTRKEKKIATAEYFKAYHARKAAEKAEAAKEAPATTKTATPKQTTKKAPANSKKATNKKD